MCRQPDADTVHIDEEERALFEQAREGSTWARNALVDRHAGLAIEIARGFSQRGLDREDLRQEAFLSLMEAIERFDPDRGVPFAGYAGMLIRQHLAEETGCRDFRDLQISLEPEAARVVRMLRKLSMRFLDREERWPEKSELLALFREKAPRLSSRTSEQMIATCLPYARGWRQKPIEGGSNGDGSGDEADKPFSEALRFSSSTEGSLEALRVLWLCHRLCAFACDELKERGEAGQTMLLLLGVDAAPLSTNDIGALCGCTGQAIRLRRKTHLAPLERRLRLPPGGLEKAFLLRRKLRAMLLGDREQFQGPVACPLLGASIGEALCRGIQDPRACHGCATPCRPRPTIAPSQVPPTDGLLPYLAVLPSP